MRTSKTQHCTVFGSPSLRSHIRLLSSSYQIDDDDEPEKLLSKENTVKNAIVMGSSDGRYSNILESVGIDAKRLKQCSNLSGKRVVSTNGVFCNRELSMNGIRAIGFDMDYTLAQYKQPAFDQLAFDGAKSKLVHKLGYPEKVLALEYDHTVSDCCS